MHLLPQELTGVFRAKLGSRSRVSDTRRTLHEAARTQSRGCRATMHIGFRNAYGLPDLNDCDIRAKMQTGCMISLVGTK